MADGLRRIATRHGGLIAKAGDLSVRYDAEGRPVGKAMKTVDLKLGEEITIAPGISVKFARITHQRDTNKSFAMLGVTAPREVSVDRLEVREVKEHGYKGRGC